VTQPFSGEVPHEPAEPETWRLPDRALLVRGVALVGLAVGGFAGAVTIAQRAGWVAAPAVALLSGAGLLALWAGAIHLTGGEKFDDHPWV
jgi:hypothetical protein